MALLLGSRGRARKSGKSGFGSWLWRLVPSFGSTVKPERPASLAKGLLLVVALICFVGGFLTGEHFAGWRGSSRTDLRAPGVIGEPELRPKSNTALIVAAYEGLAAEEAKPKALALAEYLKGKGLPSARAYEARTEAGPLWLTVVYYDSNLELRVAEERLRQLPADVPDAYLAKLRTQGKDSENGWPIRWAVQ